MYNGSRKLPRLPSFIVVGQGKSGTSMMFRVLQQNPSISLTREKELHFFSSNFERGVEWYAEQFAGATDDQIVGEVSPSYLTTEALPRIAEVTGPDTKIIFILRRPIERVYSRYLQNLCARPHVRSFDKIANSLHKWMDRQERALESCYRLFGQDNILALYFERDVACATPSFEQKILRHIGAPGTLYADSLDSTIVNPSVMPHYLWADKNPVFYQGTTDRYVIPPDTLVFCGQDRNSKVFKSPTRQEVKSAMAMQASWTKAVEKDQYQDLYDRVVAPAADRLEAAFGFDLSCWRAPARRIEYPAGEPPWHFRESRLET